MIYPRYATAIDALDLLQMQNPGQCICLLKIRILSAGGSVVAALPTALENAIAAGLQALASDAALVMFAHADLVVVATVGCVEGALAWAERLLALFERPIQVHDYLHRLSVAAGLVTSGGEFQSGEHLLAQAAEAQVAAPAYP